MRLAFCFVLVCTCLSWPAVASAEPTPVEDRVVAGGRTPSHQDLHLSGGFGWSHDADLGDAIVHSVALGYRWRFLEAGVVGDFGKDAFGGGYAMTGVSAGAALQTASGQRLSLSGVLGSDAHIEAGNSTSLPYAGIRASASQVFRSRSAWHLELGVTGFWGQDLETGRPGPATPATDEPSAANRALGGRRIGAVATVGFTWDTAPLPRERRATAARRR